MTKRSSGGAKLLAHPPIGKARITLSQRDFSTFSKALQGAFKPNPVLEAALMAVKKTVRRS